jgi:hypothetical protein
VTGPGLLGRAVERTPLTDHDGRSGSLLERIVLPDGTPLVLKRVSSENDITAAMAGRAGLEYELFAAGVLDRLPPGVGHAIVDAWRDGAETFVLMRDVSADIPGWDRELDRAQCRRLLGAAESMYTAFAGARPAVVLPAGVLPAGQRVQALWPARMRPLVGGSNPLPALIVRGWERFAELVPPRLAAAVQRIQDDPTPLLAALARLPCTLVHGDLWLVNVALEAEQVTLLDWALASWASPVTEFASFLIGNASQVRASREEIIEDYLVVSGHWQDEAGLRLGLLTGLLELGWNKALDAAGHPDPAKRRQELADLEWWLDAAAPALHELDRPGAG